MTEYRTYSVKYVEGLEAVVEAARPVSKLGMWATRSQDITLREALAAVSDHSSQSSVENPGES